MTWSNLLRGIEQRGDSHGLDRLQRQTEVPDRVQEPVEGRLVGQLAADERRAVGLRGPVQVGEGGRPGAGKLALDEQAKPVTVRSRHRVNLSVLSRNPRPDLATIMRLNLRAPRPSGDRFGG